MASIGLGLSLCLGGGDAKGVVVGSGQNIIKNSKQEISKEEIEKKRKYFIEFALLLFIVE